MMDTIRPMTDEERQRAKEKAMGNKAVWDAHKRQRRDTTNTPSPEAIVQAALERAAIVAKDWWSPTMLQGDEQAQRILALASDPAEVAAIISAAAQLNKAEDGNKERSDEEDQG